LKIRFIGLLVLIVSVIVPLYWYFPLFAKHDASAILSQYIGSAALILMAFSQLFATRFSVLETIFGPLDRIYILHKWVGILAMVAVLLHDTIDAELDDIGAETWLVDLAETLGELSLYGLLILVVISIATFIPYPLWRMTHKFMGALFALSSFHYVFMLKPFSMLDPLGLYVLLFCILGMACYLVTLIPFSLLAGRFEYRVKTIDKSGHSTVISMEAITKGIKHQAGQFSFISLQKEKMLEPHPFTISSAPMENRNLQFTIKALGDYSTALPKYIQIGDTVKVSKAYGSFKQQQNLSPQVWLASGVGITPFLAWLEQGNSSSITLYYSFKNEQQAPHLDRVKQLCSERENVQLVIVDTSKRKRLSAQEIVDGLQGSLTQSRVYFCGPKAMRKDLQQTFNSLGLRHSRFHYEEFELRSGVDVLPFFNYLKFICKKLKK
jgi:predicted ferric reductase